MVAFNKKLPIKNPNKELRYPFFSSEIDDTGYQKIKVNDPEAPDESCTITQTHNGGFQSSHVDNDVKGLDVGLSPGRGASYSGGGYNRHTGGHSEDTGENTKHSKYEGDTGHESGGDGYKGYAGSTFEGQKGDSFNHTSEGKKYSTSSGDIITEHTGDKHDSTEGDVVNSITGNKVQMVKDGEYAIHVQSGNMDTQIDNGKHRIKAGNDILIESDTKITLKVGSSTIVIDSSSVTIKSPKIDLNP